MIKTGQTTTLILFFILLSFVTSGQGDNPFDIQSRAGTVLIDSLNQDSDSFSLDRHVSFVEKRQLDLIDENPFNVSHIPVKKSKQTIEVKKAPTDTTTVTKINKELLTKSSSRNVKFLFWFFLIQLLLLTSILGINREFIKKINRSISNDNFAKIVSRDYNGGFNALFVIMYIIFILSLSIFIYLAARHYIGISGFHKFFIFLMSVSGIYLFRHVFLGFQSFVFPFSKTTAYYNFIIILFNSYLGLLLMPVNLLLAYSPAGIANISLYVGLVFIGILYLLRFLRGALNAYTFISNHLFHFFLYLCTCEIAPIFILVRFLSNSFSN